MAGRSPVLALALVLVGGCATANEHVLAFEPGAHRGGSKDLVVDVREARYAERQLTVQLEWTNQADGPLTLEPDAILLDDGGLEIPPLGPRSPAWVIDPGQTRAVSLVFPIHAQDPTTHTLRAWSVHEDGEPRAPVRVDIPGVVTSSETH